MAMKIYVYLLAFIFFISCKKTEKNLTQSKVFVLPVLAKLDTTSINLAISMNCVNECFPQYAGRFKFSDTIFVQNQIKKRHRFNNEYFDDRLVGKTDTTLTDGLELYTNYNTNVLERNYHEYTCSYPVYLVNQTPNKKALLGKDECVFGIQEACDKNGNWWPIEGRGFDFCGHGYFGLPINPQEFAVILFPKYKGEFKTKLRVRIKNGDNIYISKPFEGTIDIKQFTIKENSYLMGKIEKSQTGSVQYLFYGAEPYGMKNEFGGLHATYRFGR